MNDPTCVSTRPLPQASVADVVHALARGSLGAIPLVGGVAAELLSMAIAEPVSKRRDKWLQELADDLLALQERSPELDAKTLGENESFVSATLQATQIAMRTHQAEKLEALRNAILNTAGSSDLDDDLIAIFLNHIDVLTPWHLRLLKFFDGPKRWYEVRGRKAPDFAAAALTGMIEDAFTELRGKREFYEVLSKDLFLRGLFLMDGLGGITSGNGLLASRTTEMGKSFLAFIRRPDSSNHSSAQ